MASEKEILTITTKMLKEFSKKNIPKNTILIAIAVSATDENAIVSINSAGYGGEEAVKTTLKLILKQL